MVEQGNSLGTENSPSNLRMLDLLLLRAEQEMELKRLVEIQNGHLDVLVHPYYNDDISEEYPATPEYIRQRDEFIKYAITREKKPLVVFQDRDGEIEAKTRNIKSGTLYVVRRALSNHLESLASHHVADVLIRAGVTHVTVGGRILMFADDTEALLELEELRKLGIGKPHAMEWLSEDRLPYGCPMWVATGFLKRGFDVSLSPISSPATLDHD